jgi:hypothetical protein
LADEADHLRAEVERLKVKIKEYESKPKVIFCREDTNGEWVPNPSTKDKE